jgi:hypothetical protein
MCIGGLVGMYYIDGERMKWISVKDRLPELDVYVLGFNKNWPNEYENEKETIRTCYMINDSMPGVDEHKDPWWHVEAIAYYSTLSSPTHWMPLPEPPEEEENRIILTKDELDDEITKILIGIIRDNWPSSKED